MLAALGALASTLLDPSLQQYDRTATYENAYARQGYHANLKISHARELVGFISQPSACVPVQGFALPRSERPPRLALLAGQPFALAQPGSSNLGITGFLLFLLRPLAWHAGLIFCGLCNGLFQEGDVEATREAGERPGVFGAP